MSQIKKTTKTTTTTIDARLGDRHGCPSKADKQGCGSQACNTVGGIRGKAWVQ